MGRAVTCFDDIINISLRGSSLQTESDFLESSTKTMSSLNNKFEDLTIHDAESHRRHDEMSSLS